MFRRILVALDGSASAEHALPAAVALSRLTRATIHLVRAHEPSPSAIVTRGRWDEMSRRHELESLRATAARLVASGAADVDIALVEGPAPVAIQGEVTQRRADLVLMTDRGRSPSRIRCLGSVSASVMRQTQVPLLVMRAPEHSADLSLGPIFRNVLVAIGDPEADAEILKQAAELGRLGGGCRLWRTPDLASTEAVEAEDPAKATLRAIHAKTFDLVVLPTSRCRRQQLPAGLAQRVASASRLPIFVCPTSRHSDLPVRITALC